MRLARKGGTPPNEWGHCGAQHLAHDSAEEGEGVAASDFLDVRVGVASLEKTTDDVLAVGGRLQAIEIGRRQLFRLPTQDDPVKLDVIAHTGIGADPHMIDADKLVHIVTVIQDAVDVLRGVVAERVGHGRNGDEAPLLRAGQQFLVVPAAGHRP